MKNVSPRISPSVEDYPVRAMERDMLLFFLATTSGSADAWSYFGLGHAFVANMTGNTVLTAIAVFQKGTEFTHPLLSIVCYALGVAVASFFARNIRQGVIWAHATTFTLLLEALIMAAAEAAWIAVQRSFFPSIAPLRPLSVLLGCVAFAVGLQSGAMLQLKIPGIVTTYITGTWTALMSGLVRFAAEEKRETPTQKLNFEERLLMQGGILVVYFLSAVIAGWLLRYIPLTVGALSAAPVLFVALYAAARTRTTPRS
jgi:uncharacterized membrane protein YoaK (UPF0700 family)